MVTLTSTYAAERSEGIPATEDRVLQALPLPFQRVQAAGVLAQGGEDEASSELGASQQLPDTPSRKQRRAAKGEQREWAVRAQPGHSSATDSSTRR